MASEAFPSSFAQDRTAQALRRLDAAVRAIPIRWRIAGIAALNIVVVLALLLLVWTASRTLTGAHDEFTESRRLHDLLSAVGSDAERLQGLIHRYFTQPTPAVLAEIERRRAALLKSLDEQAFNDPSLSVELIQLARITQRFLAGFDSLRELRADVARIYDAEMLSLAREMSGLYAILDGATPDPKSTIWPLLGKSREAFSALLVAANSFYLSPASGAAEEARTNLAAIERTVPVMTDLAESDLQREALAALKERAAAFRTGLDRLSESFATQTGLLQEAIDGNQAEMVWVIDRIVARVRAREMAAEARLGHALAGASAQIGGVGLVMLAVTILAGLLVARSIARPLGQVMTAMRAIVAGDYRPRLEGLSARDEVGDMARAVEVFRENALAKRRAEEELRQSRDRAEAALAELKEAQKNLIEAEKLAALGGLVAGVAHEVNNPVGISLTVASSLARRCDTFAGEMQSGALRKSRLVEFVEGSREAALLLVQNLQRAGELIQSFKQVAVDRSHAERRTFDLKESTEQIVASLKPGLKKRQIALALDLAPDILMDSYPGPYGQVVTNLFLNAMVHAYGEGETGTVRLQTRRAGPGHVEIALADDGRGMSEEVRRRAFDPFFTTRRGHGGTGLGLHIVYNLVTRRLGGKIALISEVGRGTSFRMVLPLVAPAEEVQPGSPTAERMTASTSPSQPWPMTTIS